MQDRHREKDSMIHVRFTEAEQRRIKAACALKGISMQEYIRGLVVADLAKRKRKAGT